MASQDASPRSKSDAGAVEEVRIGPIPFDRPWDWLARGWRDLWIAPSVSLAYGVLATLLGLCLTLGLASVGLESLLPVMAGGFLLIGPLLAVGLYEKSRRLAAKEPVSLGATVSAACGSAWRLGLLAAVLLLFYIVWVRVAILLLALFMGTTGMPPAREWMSTLLFTPHGLSLLVVGTAIGAAFAAIVFATTAISLPMLMERRIDALTAMAKSARAVIDNPKPMGLWAALIAGFVALGIATLGAGLIVAFPLIGHATWHAYRDITEPAA